MQDSVPFQQQRISTRIQDDDFFIYRYKIFKCPLQQTHDIQGCPYTHPGEESARRDPTVHKYSSVTCPDAKLGRECPRGRTCKFAHHMFEYWLHPSRYRTQMCRDGASCKRTICFFAHHASELRTPPKKDRGDAAPAPPQEPRPGGPQLLAVHMDGSVAALTASAAGLSLGGGGPQRSGATGPQQPPSAQGLALAAAGQGYTIMPAPGVPPPAGVAMPGPPSQHRQGYGSGQQVMYGGMPQGYGPAQQQQQQQHPMMLAGMAQGHAPGMMAMGPGVALMQQQPAGHLGPMYVQQPQQQQQVMQQQQQQQPVMGGVQQPYWVPVHQQQLYHHHQPHGQDQGMVYQLPDHRQMQQHPQQVMQMLPAGGQQQVLGGPPGGYMLVSPPPAAAASSAMYLAAPSPGGGAGMAPMAAGAPPLTPGGVAPGAVGSSGAGATGGGPFPAWSGAPALSHPGVQSMLLVPSSSPSVLQATTLPLPGLVGAPGGLVAQSPVPGNTQWVAAPGPADCATPADGVGSGGNLPPGLT